jgi:uncharacterized membrane protein YwaF
MQQALLMSILLVTTIVPIVASRDRKASRGLWRTVLIVFGFVVVWGYLICRWYYRIGDGS